MNHTQEVSGSRRPLVLWLGSVCALIVLMVAVGGVTRLTHSGLSIVEWRPITGVIPPLTDAAWQEMFAKYQQFPEYKLLNHGMTLEEFKGIFFWEYIHRLLGRLIGLAVILPWAYFGLRGRMDRALSRKVLLGFVLGGLQGAMGWYMVKSGLSKDPHVSHYRLAAHLLLAFAVLGYLFWLILDLVNPSASAESSEPRPGRSPAPRGPVLALLSLVILQVTYGAFVAGLKAGFGFNTFPKMNDEWVPTGLLRLEPGWVNFLENPMSVQFAHRVIAWALVLAAGAFWFGARRWALSDRQMRSLKVLLGVLGIQFSLGVATILMLVPVSVATLHQLGACALFLAAVDLCHTTLGRGRIAA